MKKMIDADKHYHPDLSCMEHNNFVFLEAIRDYARNTDNPYNIDDARYALFDDIKFFIDRITKKPECYFKKHCMQLAHELCKLEVNQDDVQ